MAYDPLSTFTALQVLTAAIMNKAKDNFAALWPYSAAGDISYAASATTLTRLQKGAAYQGLRMNAGATAPEWGSVGGVSNRQGGSATDWNTPGTTNYVPANVKTQSGSITMTFSSSASAYTTVTLPVAFTNKPICFAIFSEIITGSGTPDTIRCDTVTNSNFRIVATLSASSTATFQGFWFAIGE